jgi:hypothetical protein
VVTVSSMIAPAATAMATAAVEVDAGHAATSATTAAPVRPVWTPPPPPRVVRAPEPSVTAAPPAPPPSHKSGCESPFTIGADGIRQVKPECL